MRSIFHWVCLLLLLCGLATAQETSIVAEVKEASGEAWLGIGLSKPDDAMANQLPFLPPGIGFVVTELTKGGPADAAGVRKNDLLWKMNEQMLVNEGQLATLLRLARPGEKVIISVFREGKSSDYEVTLGEGRACDGDGARRMLVDSVMRREDGAVRIVSLGEKKAEFTNENGSAEVTRVEEGDAVKILGKKGEIIFEGVLRGRPDQSAVPGEWRKPVCAMRRTLDHALSVKAAPDRQPRPRIVPPVPEEE
ncbi:MAG: PDZ domain-containing protein [Luteolibacter sp.]